MCSDGAEMGLQRVKNTSPTLPYMPVVKIDLKPFKAGVKHIAAAAYCMGIENTLFAGRFLFAQQLQRNPQGDTSWLITRQQQPLLSAGRRQIEG